jgi:FkbM family methyltransferase
VFVNLGANDGYFSILASRVVGQHGKVLAIEPQERLWKVIRKNIQLNDSYNIQLFPCAVGDKKEQILFFFTPSINTRSLGLGKTQ